MARRITCCVTIAYVVIALNSPGGTLSLVRRRIPSRSLTPRARPFLLLRAALPRMYDASLCRSPFTRVVLVDAAAAAAADAAADAD